MIEGVLRLVSEPEDRWQDSPGDGAELRRSRWLTTVAGRLAGMGHPAAAVTLGRIIVFHPAVKPTARLVRHELEHVRQWRRHPYTFPLRYVWGHVRHGYVGNPYEVAARAAEERV